jgi:hypothetical protein
MDERAVVKIVSTEPLKEYDFTILVEVKVEPSPEQVDDAY